MTTPPTKTITTTTTPTTTKTAGEEEEKEEEEEEKKEKEEEESIIEEEDDDHNWSRVGLDILLQDPSFISPDVALEFPTFRRKLKAMLMAQLVKELMKIVGDDWRAFPCFAAAHMIFVEKECGKINKKKQY